MRINCKLQYISFIQNMFNNNPPFEQHPEHFSFKNPLRSKNKKIDMKHLVKCITVDDRNVLGLTKKQYRIRFECLSSQEKQNIMKTIKPINPFDSQSNLSSIFTARNEGPKNMSPFTAKPANTSYLVFGKPSQQLPKFSGPFGQPIQQQSSFNCLFGQQNKPIFSCFGQEQNEKPVSRTIFDLQHNINSFNLSSFQTNNLSSMSRSQKFFASFHEDKKWNQSKVSNLDQTKQIPRIIQAFFETPMMQQAMLGNQKMVSLQNYQKAVQQTKQVLLKQKNN